MQQPCNSLDGCRQKVADIEYWLEVTAPHKLTVPELEGWQFIILAAIDVLRSAQIGQNVGSRDAVRNHMHQARNKLSLAIVELGNKGVTSRYVDYITSCQDNLEKALQYW